MPSIIAFHEVDDQRGDHERLDPVVGDGPVQLRHVLERIVAEVVVHDDRPALGDRLARRPEVERLAGVVHGGAADVQPGAEERVPDPTCAAFDPPLLPVGPEAPRWSCVSESLNVARADL